MFIDQRVGTRLILVEDGLRDAADPYG